MLPCGSSLCKRLAGSVGPQSLKDGETLLVVIGIAAISSEYSINSFAELIPLEQSLEDNLDLQQQSNPSLLTIKTCNIVKDLLCITEFSYYKVFSGHLDSTIGSQP
ncbi:unnamed protein product [Fraxinus pennsylvanica]|uniref:Uncharacterized protein n=1 Tax=Fraxinus pennsylvanica TaxID=56036 RepID=A0AAD2A4H8_9LAMI|nr:unnamed protein product [Fraxinus pennsylvanica]